MRPNPTCSHIVALVCLVLCVTFSPVTAAPSKRFEVAAGPATEMLRVVSAQLGDDERLLYSMDAVEGVQTKAVRGHYTALRALQRMLEGSELIVVEDREADALVVRRRTPPSATTNQSASDPTNPNLMPRKNLIASLAGFLALALGSAEAADSPNGVVAGTVLNRDTRAPIEFAFVEVEATSLRTSTDREGRFILRNVPPGINKVRVSYAGLEESVRSVNVQSGQTATAEILLAPSEVVMLAAVTVEGERTGSAAAIAQQRQAANSVSVITADQFGGTADGRIDDALKRIPGIGFQTGTFSIRGVPDTENSITFDGARLASASGESRRVETDRIPGDRIKRIEVSKSLLPNMEADAVGGTINLVSKSAFDLPRGQLTYSAAGSVIDGLNDDPRMGYAAALGYSNVFAVLGGKDNLGIDVSVTRSDKPTLIDLPFEGNEMINIFSNTPAGVSPDTLVEATSFPTNVRRRKRVETVERFNVGVKLDYKLSDESNLWFNTFRNDRTVDSSTKNTRVQISSQNVLPVDASGDPVNPTAIGVLAGFETFGVTRFRNAFTGLDDDFVVNDSVVWLLQAGGRHRWNDYRLDWSVSRSEDETVNRRADLQVSGRNATHATIDRTGNPLRPRILYTGGDTPLAQNLANIAGARQSFNVAENTDEIVTVRGDLERDLRTAIPLRLTTGFKYREQQRTNNPVTNIAYQWNTAGVGGDFSAFADKPINPFGLYPDETLSVSSAAALADALSGSTNWTFNADQATRNAINNDGAIKESIAAGYLMAKAQIKAFSLTGGVRYERTEVEGRGFSFRGNQPGVPIEDQYTPVTTKGTYDNLFPSAFAQYEFRKGLQLRASFSNGIGRPGFGLLRPTTSIVEVPQLSGAPGRITQANPELGPQFTDNYDVSLEYYFEPAGFVSFGVYRKEISDFQLQVTEFLGPDGGRFGSQFAGWELVTRTNAGDARIDGFEVAYQQQYVFLPGALSGLGAFANWTHVKAEGNFPDTGGTVVGALQNYIPDTVNVGLTYLRAPWSVRLLGFWRSDYILQINPNPAATFLRRKIFDMDLKVEYKLNDRLRLFADVYNILESEPLTAQGNRFEDHRLRPAYIYRRPVQVEVGVKGTW